MTLDEAHASVPSYWRGGRIVVSSQMMRRALLRAYPDVMAMDDDTINLIIAGRAVQVPSSEFEVSIDAQDIVQLAVQYLPVIASALSLIAEGYSLYKNMAEDRAVDEIYGALKANNPTVMAHVSEAAGKEAIRGSLYAALQDSASTPPQT